MVWLAVRRFQNRFDQKAEKRSSWARIDRLADHLRARLAVVGNTQGSSVGSFEELAAKSMAITDYSVCSCIE